MARLWQHYVENKLDSFELQMLATQISEAALDTLMSSNFTNYVNITDWMMNSMEQEMKDEIKVVFPAETSTAVTHANTTTSTTSSGAHALLSLALLCLLTI